MVGANRREFLAGVGSIGVLGMSGCLNEGGATWTAEIGPAGPLSFGTAGSDDGVLYTSSTGSVYAINPSGDIAWTYEQFEGTIEHAPVVHPTQLCVATSSGGVHAVSGGERRWSFTELSGRAGRPAIVEEGVFVVAEGNLHVLGFSDGTHREQIDTPLNGAAWAEATDDSVLLARSERLLSISRSDYTIQWEHPIQSGTQPVVSEGGVAVASQSEGALAVLDPTTGAIRWTGLESDSLATPYGFRLGDLYVTDTATGRVAGYLSDGEQRWESRVDGAESLSRPCRDPSNVYVVDRDPGTVHTLAVPDGEVGDESSVGTSVNHYPHASLDYLYVPTDKGVVAVET